MSWVRVGHALLARFLPLAIIGMACLPAAAQMFTRVTNELHFAQSDAGAFVWFDYDNDGWVDVLCAGGWNGSGSGNRLFHNNGSGTFTQASQTNFAGAGIYGDWATVADFNDDGLLDVIAANCYTPSYAVDYNPYLYLNQGNGRFTRIGLSPSAILNRVDARAFTVAALDYDGDGLVDLALGRYDVPSRSYLLQNTGQGVFSAVTNTAWTLQAAAHESISSADFNGDGVPDLLGVGASRPRPFRDAGGGGFVLDTNSLLYNFQVGYAPLSVAWGDYNDDGNLDVAINYVVSAPTKVQVFLNDGSGVFTRGFSSAALAQYISCADYDNDGWLDLYTTGFNSRSRLYRNLGGGSFTEVLNEPIAQDVFGQWPTAGWGDYDNDGFLDLLVGASGSSNMLYRNSTNGNHWLKVKVVGQASNRAAIGTVVRVTATIGGQERRQMRVVQAQSSFTEIVPHFGLGDATTVTTLRIEWPSGIVQTLTNVAPDQTLTVAESQDYIGPLPALGAPTVLPNGVQFSITEPLTSAVYALEASTDLVNWTKLMARTSAGGTFNYTDMSSVSYSRRFYRVVVP